MKVSAIAPQHRALEAPSCLRELQGWLCWRLEHHAGETKGRKVPYYVDGGKRHGKQGTPEDRAKLTTFAAAKAAAARRGMTGVGLALMPEWEITALDFDHCVSADGSLPPEVAAIAHRTYAEYSPSGKGIRAFVRGVYPNIRTARMETFTSAGFVTFTGNVLPEVELVGYEDTVAALDDLVRPLYDACRAERPASQPNDTDDFTRGFEPKLGLTPEQMEGYLDQLDPDMFRPDWIKVMMALFHETEGDDTGFYLFNDWSALGAKYPGEDEIRKQWESLEGRNVKGQRQVTMASVIHMTKDNTLRLAASPEQVAEKASEVPAGTPTGAACTPADFGGRFPVGSLGDSTRRAPVEWLVKGVLPQADLVAIYGASGAGKSFVALDMAIKIARGEPWRGRRTKKTRVLAVIAEGSGGYGKRVKAYCRQHGLQPDDIDMGIITVPPNILDSEDISQLVASIKAVGDVGVIFFDTLAQVTPGANENSGEDMGRALANLRIIRDLTGATIVIIHHAGKDLSRGLRGWSGIHAAVDAAIEVSRAESGEREIRIAKQKDGDDGLAWGFTLSVVVVGMDTDGDEETSCIIDEAELVVQEKERKGVKRRGRMERHVLEVTSLIGGTGIALPDLVSKAVDMLPPAEAGARDTRRQVVTRAVHSICREKDGPLGLEGQFVVFFE